LVEGQEAHALHSHSWSLRIQRRCHLSDFDYPKKMLLRTNLHSMTINSGWWNMVKFAKWTRNTKSSTAKKSIFLQLFVGDLGRTAQGPQHTES
jgi:hypothetical protein